MPFKKLSYVEPLKLYAALREYPMPFILHSAEKDSRKSRYTYISAAPEFRVEVDERGTHVDGTKISHERKPFVSLRKLMKDRVTGTRFAGGFAGYIAYDAVHNYVEGRVDEPSVFGYYPWVFIYDYARKELEIFYLREPPFDPERIVSWARDERMENDGCASLKGTDADMDTFTDMVERGKEHILAGDVFQVVLSREYRLSVDMSPLKIYENLTRINPSPYTFLLEFKKAVVGASPETMASVEGRRVRINPIAGTVSRGKTEAEDEELRRKLLRDEKERAEHVMLVDLARNDVRRVSKPGSVRLVRFFDVLRYSHVQHIESEVIGELEDDKDSFDAMEAAFPAGTLTGAPKLRAMEIIEVLERSRRGIYGGAVGYFSATGDADFAIAIRMLEMEGKEAKVRAGAGIVADSVPAREYMETEHKMAAVLRALGVRE
ncbi:MAG: anthranilate synthase component I [Thermoplasmata archaeon]|nr:anthranilate synthase component I [Thermoplasmata archaeon]